MKETSCVCAVCGSARHDLAALAEHFITEAAASDIGHVMWLNRNVTKYEVGAAELTALLRGYEQRGATSADRIAR